MSVAYNFITKHLRNIFKNAHLKVKVGVFFLLVLGALIILTYFIFVTEQKCQKHPLDSVPGIAPSGVPETQKKKEKKNPANLITVSFLFLNK